MHFSRVKCAGLLQVLVLAVLSAPGNSANPACPVLFSSPARVFSAAANQNVSWALRVGSKSTVRLCSGGSGTFSPSGPYVSGQVVTWTSSSNFVGFATIEATLSDTEHYNASCNVTLKITAVIQAEQNSFQVQNGCSDSTSTRSAAMPVGLGPPTTRIELSSWGGICAPGYDFSQGGLACQPTRNYCPPPTAPTYGSLGNCSASGLTIGSCSVSCNAGYQPSTPATQCIAGGFGVGAGILTMQSCAPCPVGTYKASPSPSSCSACPAGQTATSTGSTTCVCAPGFTGPSGGPCTACPSNTYKSAAGSAACTACPANSNYPATGLTAVSGCRCNNGYHGFDGGPCSANFWQCVPGITSPVACGPIRGKVLCGSNDGVNCLWGTCGTVTPGSSPLTTDCPGWGGTSGSACSLLGNC